jgi:PAS domain-containing protein
MSKCKDTPGEDAGNHPSNRTGEDAAAGERLQWEQERELTLEFFRLVYSSESIPRLIDAAVDFFRRQSQCEAIAVRLREGADYPYFHALGFSERFLVCENSLCVRDCYGEVVSDANDAATLECRCGEVLRGGFDPAQPYFTANGSFWTNSASRQGGTRPSNHRGRCGSEGYESIALIALRAGKDRIGLLQMNDRRQGMFTPEKILLWESFAGYLAVALARFNAEETLRKSEQRLAQAVSIARLGIFEHDHRTGVSHSSQAFRAFYGLDEELPVTREQVLSRIVAEDRASLEEALRRSLDPAGDGLLQHVHCIQHPEGVRWLNARAQTFFEGEDGARNPVRTVGAVLDITRQKQAELEIAASRRHLRTALEAANFGIWSRDLETGIFSGDAVTHSILGWGNEQLLTKEGVLDFIVPEDRERFLQDRARLEQCNFTVSSEFRVCTPQNGLQWIAIWGHQVRDRHGKPILLTGSFRTSPAASETKRSSRRWRSRSATPRRWRPSATWRAPCPTTSTISSWSSAAMRRFCRMVSLRPRQRTAIRWPS